MESNRGFPPLRAWPGLINDIVNNNNNTQQLQDLFSFPKIYRIYSLLFITEYTSEEVFRHRCIVVGFRDSGIYFKSHNIIILVDVDL